MQTRVQVGCARMEEPVLTMALELTVATASRDLMGNSAKWVIYNLCFDLQRPLSSIRFQNHFVCVKDRS